MCGDSYRVVYLFDSFKDLSVYFRWIYDGILFFWKDILGEFCGEYVVDCRGNSFVLDAAVSHRVCSLPSMTLGSTLMMTLSFLVFFNVTRLEIGSWFSFFVVNGAVTFLNIAMF